MQQWPGSEQAAEKIFEHLGIPYTRRVHGSNVIFEGKKWGKLFCFTCVSNPREIGLQTRTPKTYKDQGGILLGSCGLLDLTEKGVATIHFPTGEVFINRWGIHTTVK